MMKIYSILIFFCALNVLICEPEGVTIRNLENALANMIPYAKSFHPAKFTLPRTSNLNNLKMDYTDLVPGNVQFKYDDFGLLHITFVNLKLHVSGAYYVKNGNERKTINFSADLNNLKWERTYAISSKIVNKLYNIKFQPTADFAISFKTSNIKLGNYLNTKSLVEKMLPGQLKTINFSAFKQHLEKLVSVLFETLQTNLNK